MEPKKRKDVKAEYPADAVAAHKTGTVYVDVTIGPDGRVIDAKVIKSEPLFDKAALDAVRQWEYEPTIVGGVAVSVVITIGVKFSIDEPEGRSQ